MKAAVYAERTTVSPEKSRAEIETMLTRYGANSFGYAWENNGQRAVIQFRAANRMVRFQLEMPSPTERRFTHVKIRGYEQKRAEGPAREAHQQAVRQSWRSLALVVKAKLEAVASGITTFEQEFLAHILLPNGQTVSGWFTPQLEEAYEKGQMPRSMLLLGDGN